jgi:antitoxin Phd
VTSLTGVIARKSRWQLQEAKARLSELVRQARSDGPQVITLHGEDAVVVLSTAEYERLTRPPKRLIDVLMNSPIRPEDVDLFVRQRELDARPNPFDFDD